MDRFDDHVSAFSGQITNAAPARWQRKNAAKERNGGSASDRFIPKRSAMDFADMNFEMTKENGEGSVDDPAAADSDTAYGDSLNNALRPGSNAKILAFKSRPKPAVWDSKSELSSLYSANRGAKADAPQRAQALARWLSCALRHPLVLVSPVFQARPRRSSASPLSPCPHGKNPRIFVQESAVCERTTPVSNTK